MQGEVETRWLETEEGIGTVKRTVMWLPSHLMGAGHPEAERLSHDLEQP